MHDLAKLFYDIGEPYAAGLFEEPEKGYFYRHALANARYLEQLPPAIYHNGEHLYPSNGKFFHSSCAVTPQFATTYWVNWEKLEAKSKQAADVLREFYEISHNPGGWTHAAPNFKRIIREGLASYRERILRQPDGEFRDGLLALVDAMQNYLCRSISYLRSANAPADLIAALERVPFQPATTYYEGLVSWNVIFHFDGADNLGCLDDGLIHLYRGEDYTDVIGELFGNLDAAGTWSCTVGPNYNPITEQAVRAIRHRRRPMLELMTTPEMPDRLWELAVDNIRVGSCNPSFYNAHGIHDMLKGRFPHIPEEELALFCGCGCTETNLQGLTRAGGTDDNIPLLLILEKYMHQNLASAPSFEAFFEGLCTETEARIDAQLDEIVARYDYMASYLPNPIRTLFTDDCIEKEQGYFSGGARYTFAVPSDSGIPNTVDSLLVVKELVFDRKLYSAKAFIRAIDDQDPAFLRLI
ncbi:MAG: hypothetical protein IKZ21_07420, partial [Clostridia bacterium]|nr:hypothetical protein [Clostridia bacterium]